MAKFQKPLTHTSTGVILHLESLSKKKSCYLEQKSLRKSGVYVRRQQTKYTLGLGWHSSLINVSDLNSAKHLVWSLVWSFNSPFPRVLTHQLPLPFTFQIFWLLPLKWWSPHICPFPVSAAETRVQTSINHSPETPAPWQRSSVTHL